MKWYAVRVGRKCNVVVQTWEECSLLVDGYSGAIFKSFRSWEKDKAEKFAKSGSYKNQRQGKDLTEAQKTQQQHRRFAEKNPCILRGRVDGKMRCIIRSGPRVVGANYTPSDDSSVPWDD